MTVPQWIRRPDGPGWIREATSSTEKINADSSSRPGRVDWSKLTAAVTAFTALAALVFTAQSLAATRDQINVAEQGQITDRYTTAVNQISTPGADHLETRLGGIYALERLATDSPRDQPTIIEVLSAFVRSNAPLPVDGSNQACPPVVALDVQAALTVLGRRNPAHDASALIDLSHSCLNYANLTNAFLTHANLTNARLNNANLTNAFLAYVNLTHADLGANLTNANLTNAFLSYADLTHADLTNANFTNADLTHADLTNANFTNADLTQANLIGANVTGVIGLAGH